MTEPPRAEPPDDGGGGPGEQSRERRDAHGSQPGNEAVEPRARSGRAGPSASWLQWIRAHPALAVAVLVFCLTAVGGLVLSIPPGIMSTGRSGRLADRGRRTCPRPCRRTPRRGIRGPPPTRPRTARRSPGTPGSWSPRPRRRLEAWPWSTPTERSRPAGESRYEWFVRLQGPRSLLEEVNVVDGNEETLSRRIELPD